MYKKIMVPLDGSAMAECVLDHVETIGRGCGAEKVILVRVVEPMDVPASAQIRFKDSDLKAFEADKEALAQKYLGDLAKKLGYRWAKVETQVLVGSVANSLVKYLKEGGFDLVVIATHGRSGAGRWVWGSTADRLLRSSCTPVFMVRVPGCVPDMD